MKNSHLKNTIHLLVLIFFLSGCSTLTVPNWNTHLKDPGRTNYSPDSFTPSDSIAKLWSRKIARSIKPITGKARIETASPIIVNDKILIGTTKGRFYGFDINTGRKIFKVKTNGPVEGTATYDGDETVYFSTSRGKVYSVNSNDGNVNWTFDFSSEGISAPIYLDGLVYVQTGHNRLYALNSKTGEKWWAYSQLTDMEVYPRLITSPATNGKIIVSLFQDGYMVVIDIKTGRELWKERIFEDVENFKSGRKSPAISDGLIFIVDSEGTLKWYDIKSHDVKGSFSDVRVKDFAINDNILYIAGTNTFHVIDYKTSELSYSFSDLPGEVQSLAVGKDVAVVMSNVVGKKFYRQTSSYLTLLDLANGKVLDKKFFSKRILQSPVISKGVISFLTERSRLYLYTPIKH